MSNMWSPYLTPQITYFFLASPTWVWRNQYFYVNLIFLTNKTKTPFQYIFPSLNQTFHPQYLSILLPIPCDHSHVGLKESQPPCVNTDWYCMRRETSPCVERHWVITPTHLFSAVRYLPPYLLWFQLVLGTLLYIFNRKWVWWETHP